MVSFPTNCNPTLVNNGLHVLQFIPAVNKQVIITSLLMLQRLYKALCTGKAKVWDVHKGCVIIAVFVHVCNVMT